MRTSDSCHRNSLVLKQPAAHGFSLLEMLVVLVLVSAMTALVAPRLQNTVAAIATSGDRAEVARQLEDLPLLARRLGQPIDIAVDGDMGAGLLKLPGGWTVTALTKLNVAANGVCTDARFRVENGGSAEEWSVAMPDCRVRNGD